METSKRTETTKHEVLKHTRHVQLKSKAIPWNMVLMRSPPVYVPYPSANPTGSNYHSPYCAGTGMLVLPDVTDTVGEHKCEAVRETEAKCS